MATTIVTKYGSDAPAASDIVRGELAVDTENGRLYTENSSAAVVELGSNPSGNITFGDNGKAIFGAGSDLQIYHDGSHSYISDSGTGYLRILASDYLQLMSSSSEVYFNAAANGGVTLYHDNSGKISTTATGIQVTGNIANASGDMTLDVTGNIKLDADSSNIYLADGGTDIGLLSTNNQDLNIRNLITDKDIYFQGNDDGSTITALTLDMSSAGAATFNSSVTIPSDIIHAGDADTLLQFNSADSFRVITGNEERLKANNGEVVVNDNSADMDFRVESDTNTHALFVEGSSGNVGIGISSLVNPLEVKLTSNTASKTTGSAFDGAAIRLNGELGPSTNSEIAILAGQNDTLSAGIGFLRESSSTWGTALKFYTRPSATTGGTDDIAEVGRWDSAGNLLVGTTSTDTAAVGFRYRSSLDAISSVADGGISAYFGRRSSAGDIVALRKDDAIIGSLGVSAFNGLQLGSASGTGFRLDTNDIMPMKSGSALDDAVNLGYPTVRFKNLYLSSGVVFGATGGAVTSKTLDDYEEGTWTPTVASNASPGGYTYQVGYYTKVGRKVHVTAQIKISSVGNFAGATININGLPYTIANVTTYDPTGILVIKGAAVAKSDMFSRGVANTNYARIEQGNGTTNADMNCNADVFDTDTICYFDLTYFTS